MNKRVEMDAAHTSTLAATEMSPRSTVISPGAGDAMTDDDEASATTAAAMAEKRMADRVW